MRFNRSDWKTYEQGIQKEWLLTNGIGGFSSSTIIGANARRYHGLLFASLRPPVERHLTLSKIDETLIIDNVPYEIHSFSTGEYKKTGFNHQQEFRLDPFPHYTYLVRNIKVEKKITMINGRNAVMIHYRIINTKHDTVLRLAPLVNFRDFHHAASYQNLMFDIKKEEKGLTLNPKGHKHALRIMTDDAKIEIKADTWFYGMFYDVEQRRGLDSYEDHYMPCSIDVSIKPWEEKEYTVYAEAGSMDEIIFTDREMPNAEIVFDNERKRIDALQEKIKTGDNFAKTLAKAADDFIVYRESTGSKTILAGYPWFSDWGRDAMIALPGLTLVTGRFDDAKSILHTYTEYLKDGLIPNMFPDGGSDPLYNSVDAVLWFFEAVNKYLEYTGDIEFIGERIYDSLCSIIAHFRDGTVFDIHMDEDMLISAGSENTQLTWMDAKVDDWVVTPRHGKAVEINALWYNALRITESIAKMKGEDSSDISEIADKVHDSFMNTFWNDKEKCLYDVISGSFRDRKIRPNQIFALSLSYPVIIDMEKARQIVSKVWDDLYTPFGLRSLAVYEDEYRGVYSGDRYSRDGAYHQGTVWTWPIGHFITAFMRAYNDRKSLAAEMIEPFKNHLYDGCIGSISEIFDGNEPHFPRGCFSQAWSVAEVLRVYLENRLQ